MLCLQSFGGKRKIINARTITDEHPRHNETEALKHVIQCRSIVSMRVEFIFNLINE